MLKLLLCVLVGGCYPESPQDSGIYITGILCSTPEAMIAFDGFHEKRGSKLYESFTAFNTALYPESPCAVVIDGVLAEETVLTVQDRKMLRLRFGSMEDCLGKEACNSLVFYGLRE